jgi:hypothetical protein
VWFFRFRFTRSCLLADEISSRTEGEAKLRLLYNEGERRRMQAIRAKAGNPMVLILSLALVLGGMVIVIGTDGVCRANWRCAISVIGEFGVKLYYKLKCNAKRKIKTRRIPRQGDFSIHGCFDAAVIYELAGLLPA